MIIVHKIKPRRGIEYEPKKRNWRQSARLAASDPDFPARGSCGSDAGQAQGNEPTRAGGHPLRAAQIQAIKNSCTLGCGAAQSYSIQDDTESEMDLADRTWCAVFHAL